MMGLATPLHAVGFAGGLAGLMSTPWWWDVAALVLLFVSVWASIRYAPGRMP